MRRPSRSDRAVASTVRSGQRWPTLGLFGETMLVSLWVTLLVVPIVTAVPAMAAGAGHLRRHVRGEQDDLASLGRDTLTALRELWPVALTAPALMILLGLNLLVVRGSALPGAPVVVLVSAVLAVVVSVVVLRLVGAWTPGGGVRAHLARAGARSVEDLRGSLLLVLAVGMCVLFVWMYLPLAVTVAGLITLAALAVEMAVPTPDPQGRDV